MFSVSVFSVLLLTVKFSSRNLPELSPNRYGLSQTDSVDPFGILFAKSGQMTVEEIEKQLENLYCGNVGVEFSYIEVSPGFF